MVQAQASSQNTGRGTTAKGQTNTAAKKFGSAARKDSVATPPPAQIVFECFECGIPCQVDPKLGVNALPKNMVLIPTAQPTAQSTDGNYTGDVSTTGATKPTQAK